MGKVRVKTIGDEHQEKEEQLKAKKRAEAKRAQKDAEEPHEEKESATEESPEKKRVVKKQQKNENKPKHSKAYVAAAAYVDSNKRYSLTEALALLPKVQRAKFDETVELHINTAEKGVSGTITLPHGTGKAVRVAIANQNADPKKVEELVHAIQSGQLDFDVLIATPGTMPKLARVAKVLGPRGLMPNPKNGTVTPKPEEVAKKFAGGQITFKTEAKFPILHLTVGKASFGEKKLEENITTMIQTVKTKNIKTVTLKSTMSPAITINLASL